MSRLATLAILAGVVLAGAAHAEEEGKDRWAVKTAPPLSGPPITVAIEGLIELPNADGVAHNDARYQSARLPLGPPPTVDLDEGRVIKTTGWLWLVAFEDDGDFHMQISASATAGAPCLIVEVPDPKYIADPALKAQATAVRAWVVANIFRGKNPSQGGSLLKHPVRVTLAGALFYDDSHVGTPPRGKKGLKAGTLWELHPVTAIGWAP